MIDLFGGVPGTTLTAHTPTGGGSWTLRKGNNPLFTANGRVRPGGGSASAITHSLVPPTADYTVYADIVHQNSAANNEVGIMARHQGATDSLYAFEMRGTQWRLVRTLAGVGASINSATVSFVEDQIYSAALRVTGTLIEGLVNDVVVCQVTDIFIAAAGLAGLYLDGTGTVNDTTTPHLVNYTTSFYTPSARCWRGHSRRAALGFFRR